MTSSEKCKAWRAKNKDKVRAYEAARPGRNNKFVANWRKANPEKRAVHNARYNKADKPTDELDVFALEEAHSLRFARKEKTGFDWHVDHTVPVSKGGTNAHTNIQVVPARWNLEKRDRHSDRFSFLNDAATDRSPAACTA